MEIFICSDCGEEHDGVVCQEHCAFCCFAHHRESPNRARIIALYNHFVLGQPWIDPNENAPVAQSG